MSRLSRVNMHNEAKTLAAGYLGGDLKAKRTILQYAAKPAQRKLGVLLLVGYHLAKQDIARHATYITEILDHVAG